MLKAIVGLAFLYVSVRMVYEGSSRRRRAEEVGNMVPGTLLAKTVIGLTIGILAGIVGLGGGYALVPSFIYLIGTSLVSFISMAVVSASFKMAQGLVDFIAALSLGVGTALGAQIGARLVPRVPSSLIKLIFGLVFLYISLKFVLDVFGVKV